MARYIDAEVLIKEVERVSEQEPLSNTLGWTSSSILETIKYMPTADVAPVRHGKWEYMQGIRGCYCSECDGFHLGEYKFCHWCGAKMDGKEGES